MFLGTFWATGCNIRIHTDDHVTKLNGTLHCKKFQTGKWLHEHHSSVSTARVTKWPHRNEIEVGSVKTLPCICTAVSCRITNDFSLVPIIWETYSSTTKFVTGTSQHISYLIYFLWASIPKSSLYSLHFRLFDSISSESRNIWLSPCDKWWFRVFWENRSETWENTRDKIIVTESPQVNKGVRFPTLLCTVRAGQQVVTNGRAEAVHLPLIDDPITSSESALLLAVVPCSPTAGAGDSFWFSFSLLSNPFSQMVCSL